MNNDAIAKIKMLKSSQECLTFGLLSLLALIGVPFAIVATATREDSGGGGITGFCFLIAILSLVGFPFAVAAMVVSAKVRPSEKKYWNAARPYRIVGGVCAIFSVVSSFLVGALVGFLIANANLFGD